MRLPESWIDVTLTACVIVLGCSRQTRNSEAPAPSIRRGDHVVVESSAATFYEAQVLAIENAKLRVQALPSGDAALVPVSDVYRLPTKPAQLPRASLAICGAQGQRWFGCRIVSADSEGANVIDIAGGAYRLTWLQIVEPNALTELNLKRLFDKASERHDFEQELAFAGAPKSIAGWRPLPGKSGLARIDGNWRLVVIESEKHGKYRVRFPGSQGLLEVDPDHIVPEPPYPMDSSLKSRFALLRPADPSQPWTTVRLVSIDSLEAVVESVGARRRTVPIRDVCPLENTPSSKGSP